MSAPIRRATIRRFPLAIRHWPLAILSTLLFLVLLRTAWVCDDAFISFTASANLIDGMGLTFQPYERVQAFSNPLWTLIMAGVYALTGEVWISSMVLGMALSLVALAVLIPSGKQNQLQTLLIGTMALLSASFVDFSTSGLENALSHLLAVLFAAQFLKERKDARWLRNLSLLASLLLLNRPDFLFLVAPAGVYALFVAERKGKWPAILLGLLPILLWEGFSLIYYGFLLPNTWYAKLGVGEGRWFLLEKGLTYLWDTLHDDPLTVLAIAGGLATAIWGKNRKMRLLMAGVLLYTLAVTAAGGDFMRGRMLTVPFVLSLYVLLRSPLPSWSRIPLAGLVIWGLILPDCPLWSGPNYHIGRTEKPWELYRNNITDERAMYWQKTGWLANHGESEHPMRILQREARENRSRGEWNGIPQEVKVVGSIGIVGYRTQPGVHLLDEASLSEPLLARLPALQTRWWRAGHRPRAIPKGYRKKLIDSAHKMKDGNLTEYVDKLQLVTRGPLWSGARWKAIFKFLRGDFRDLIDTDYYRSGMVDLSIAAEGINGVWAKPGRWRPLRVIFPKTVTADSLHIRANSGRELSLEFSLQGQKVGEATLKPDNSRKEGNMEWYEMKLPGQLQKTGFDAVVLQAAIFHGDFVLRDLWLSGVK